LRWASAIATDVHLDDALGNAAEDLATGLGGARADLVVAFVTDHHAGRFARFADAASDAFPGALVVGCTAGGTIGGGVEIEHQPALSLTAASLPGVRLTPLRLGESRRRWATELADVPPDPTFLLLPCPLTFPTEDLIEYLDERWPAAVKIGGLASGGMTLGGPAGNSLFLGRERFAGGAVGVALDGDLQVDTIVAQGCRPIGEPMIITRADGNVAFALDGERALDALEKLLATLTPAERSLARHSLFLGVAMKGGGPLEPGDFLIRNLLGIDPESGAVAVGAPLQTGQIVQFHLRDAATAAGELAAMLGNYDNAEPEGALLFACVGRGRLLYGAENHDTRAFRKVFGDVALGGFFCNGEIGPVHRRTFLHGYTSAFALFRRRLPLS
jgi:small ligand-binding sensory domain FIST